MKISTKNLKATRIALAAVALFGIGAAATSATWTDSGYFKQDASTASMDIKVSNSGVDGDYVDANSIPNAVPISSDPNFLASIKPAQTRSTSVYVKNTGDAPVGVQLFESYSGSLFDPAQTQPLTTAFTIDGKSIKGTKFTVAPGTAQKIDVAVTSPDWSGSTKQNQTGSLYLNFQAQYLNN